MSDADEVMWFSDQLSQTAGAADNARRRMTRTAGQIGSLIGGTATGEDHVIQERLGKIGAEFGRLADDHAHVGTRIRQYAEYLHEREHRGGAN